VTRSDVGDTLERRLRQTNSVGASQHALARLGTEIVGVIVLGNCLLFGQSFSGTISGIVRDSSEAVIPQATITVRNTETGQTRATESGASGGYSLPLLPVGPYELTVEKAGFRKQVRRGITLSVAQEAVLNLTPQFMSYTVSKAALWTLTQTLAQALAPRIRVNAVAPGPTDTPMLGRLREGEEDPQQRERFIAGMPEIFRLGVPLGKLGQPEDVASAVLYLASDEAHHVTGVIFNVDGMAQLS